MSARDAPDTASRPATVNDWPSTAASWSSARSAARQAVQARGDERDERLGHVQGVDRRRPAGRPRPARPGDPARRASGPSRPHTAGCRRRAPRCADTALWGSPGASPASNDRISGSASGSSEMLVKFFLPAPQSGRRSSSSGLARVTMYSGSPRVQSSTWSMKSSKPGSAQCRSSNTSAVVPWAAIRSKNVRHDANSSSEPPGGRSPTPSSASRPTSIQRRSSSSGTKVAMVSRTLRRVVASSSPWTSPQRYRTMSPSAQKVMPSPYAGERPSCHQTGSTSPSA